MTNRGIFWELESSAWFKKKKKPTKNLFGIISSWKRCEKCTYQLLFRVSSTLPGAAYQSQFKANVYSWYPLSRGYSPITPLENNSKYEMEDYSREEDQTTMLLARNTGITGVWESTNGIFPNFQASFVHFSSRKSFFIIQSSTILHCHKPAYGNCFGLPRRRLQMRVLARLVYKPLMLIGILWFGLAGGLGTLLL